MVDQNKTISLSDFPFDIEVFKPGHPEVEIFDRGSENEDHRFSIKGPNEKYCIISEDEKFAFDLMNGERTLDEIAALFMEQKGRIALTMIRKLTLRLWTEGLLDTGEKKAPDIETSEDHKRLMILPLPAKVLSKILAPLIGITLLNPLSIIALIGLGGFGCYLINEIYSQPISIPALFSYQGNPIKGMAVMFLCFLVASLIRYSVLIAAYGGKRINISRSGLMIGQILPGFYIEGPGITALKAKSRFFVRVSGILVLFGVSGLLLVLFKYGGATPETKDLLFQASVFFLIYIIYQCCPLLDNDVYLGCADYLDEPYLRKSSFAFVSRHIKKFFSPSPEEKGDNVIYIMFCAAAILWLAFSAQMILSAISQNAKIISGLFVEKQSFSSQVIIFITLFPVLCALLASLILVYKFLTKSISSQEVFKNTRNQIIFCSILLLGFLMLLRIAPNSTRFYFHVLMAGFAFYLVMWHSISISNKLKGSSTSTQFIFLSLVGITGLAYTFISIFNIKSGYILLTSYTSILLIYSLFNIKHEWGEFINRKRDSMAIIAAMILITAGCMYISKDLQKESLNISFNRQQQVDVGIVNDRAYAMYCLIAGSFSLILNVPGVLYRRSTQSFAPNFSIVFASHMILYFLAIQAFSKNIFPIIESISACSLLLILGIGAMKTAITSKHYIDPYPLKAFNEKETLSTAFKYITDNMMRSIKDDFGEYRCGIISSRFNKHAAKVGWTFTLEEPANDENINTLGNVYDQSFAVFKNLCVEECGKSYTDELIHEIDDHFHSSAREIINSRVNSFTHSKDKKTHLNLTKEKKADIIKDIILFQDIDSSLKEQLLDCLHSVSYEVGDLIIKQHDDGDRLFILAEGKAQVEIEDLAGHSNVVSYLSENEFFGEIALLTSSERTASIRAVEKCNVLYLKKKDFDTFLGLNPEKKEKIISTLDYLRLLKTIPLFRGIDSSVINLFASQMLKEEFKKGENIINQGDEGDKFYIILEGTVSVHVVRDDNKSHQVATLSKGEYFGEIALFKNIPRTATITVDTDSAVVLSLQKEHFVKAIDNQNSLEVNLENVTHRRIVQMMG